MRKILLTSIILFSLLILASPMLVRADTNISSCSVLNSVGETYLLNQSITNSASSSCMNVTANNVTLDCQGYTIDGTDTSSSYGVYAVGKTNLTIRNCVISDWYRGVQIFSSSHYANLTNNTFGSNTADGIYIASSDYGSLTDNIIDDNLYGVEFIDSDSWIVSNNIFSNSGSYGFRYENNASSNLIYNNLFNNTNSIYGYWDGTNQWNTTRQNGTRIYSNGFEIGGNYWTNPSGTGYSDTCTDGDFDGFCDTFYNESDDTVDEALDYLPLSDEYSEFYLVVTFNYSSVSFGELQVDSNNNTAQNQTDGIYNVTVNSNVNYKIEASGLDFTDGGSEGFGIGYLRVDTNTTLGNIALSDSIIMSESNQIVNTNIPKTETANFFGYWLSVPSGQYATTYNSDVTITYSQV